MLSNSVIPAKAGISLLSSRGRHEGREIPAFAGMTIGEKARG